MSIKERMILEWNFMFCLVFFLVHNGQLLTYTLFCKTASDKSINISVQCFPQDMFLFFYSFYFLSAGVERPLKQHLGHVT